MTSPQENRRRAALAEFSDFNLKMARGQQMLQRIKDEDVQIATADKEVVFRAGQDHALPLQGHCQAHARTSRCWSPTARSAATR